MSKSKTSKIVIEKVRRSDLESIIELYKQLNPESDFKEIDNIILDSFYKNISSNEHFNLFVLKDNGKIMSTCMFTTTPNLAQGLRPNGVIESFVTDENYRRQGYGKKLIKYILEMAEDLECVKVSLLTKNENEATKIYENMGFKENLRKSFIIFI